MAAEPARSFFAPGRFASAPSWVVAESSTAVGPAAAARRVVAVGRAEVGEADDAAGVDELEDVEGAGDEGASGAGEGSGVDVALADADAVGAGDGPAGAADAAGLMATSAPTSPVSTSRRARTRLTRDEG